MNSELQPPFDAYLGDEPYLFVSYAHVDKISVYSIIEGLYQRKARIWYDEGIQASSNWMGEIADKIEKCNCFLIFITPKALQSDTVQKEINYAIRKKKRMFIIYLEETNLSSEIDFQIGGIQALFKYKMTEEAFWRKLMNELSEVTSKLDDNLEVETSIVDNSLIVTVKTKKGVTGDSGIVGGISQALSKLNEGIKKEIKEQTKKGEEMVQGFLTEELRKKNDSHGDIMVYISCSRKDINNFDIKKIIYTLESNEKIKRVFYYEGDSYNGSIEYINENLPKCHIALMFCSPNAIKSEIVGKELKSANEMSKRIIPVFTKVEYIPRLLSSYSGVVFDPFELDKSIEEIYHLIQKKLK